MMAPRDNRFRLEERTLHVPDRAAYRVGVVSDTHGHPHSALFSLLAEERPDAILHAGDVGGWAIIDRLDAIAPTVAVRGNTDARGEGLPEGAVITFEDEAGPVLVVYLTHIGVWGTHARPEARVRAESAGAGLLVCGHSHTPLIARDRGLAIFNPGSCGPRRLGLPIVFGVIDLSPTGARLRHMDCETGRLWTPPDRIALEPDGENTP